MLAFRFLALSRVTSLNNIYLLDESGKSFCHDTAAGCALPCPSLLKDQRVFVQQRFRLAAQLAEYFTSAYQNALCVSVYVSVCLNVNEGSVNRNRCIQTCYLAGTDLLMSSDHKPKSRSARPTFLIKPLEKVGVN